MRRPEEGRIHFNGKESAMSCAVRHVSDTGARAAVGDPYLMPAEFEFVVSGFPARPVRKGWVKQNEIGIEFPPEVPGCKPGRVGV